MSKNLVIHELQEMRQHLLGSDDSNAGLWMARLTRWVKLLEEGDVEEFKRGDGAWVLSPEVMTEVRIRLKKLEEQYGWMDDRIEKVSARYWELDNKLYGVRLWFADRQEFRAKVSRLLERVWDAILYICLVGMIAIPVATVACFVGCVVRDYTSWTQWVMGGKVTVLLLVGGLVGRRFGMWQASKSS